MQFKSMKPNKLKSTVCKVANATKLISSSAKTPVKDMITPTIKSEDKKQLTIKDLCSEEKYKIGNLIKRLAEEKAIRETVTSKCEQQIKELNDKLQQYKQANEQLKRENIALNKKLKQSLKLLDSTNKAQEILKLELTASQLKSTTPAGSKEMQSKSISTSANLTNNKLSQLQADAEQKIKEEEKNNDNTINEIKCLKGDILNLTNTLKSLNFSPNRAESALRDAVYSPANVLNFSANKSLAREDELRQSKIQKYKERMKEEIMKIKSEYISTATNTKHTEEQRNKESIMKSMQSLNSHHMQSDTIDSKYESHQKESTPLKESDLLHQTGSFPVNIEQPVETNSILFSPIVEQIRKPVEGKEKSNAKGSKQAKNMEYDPSLYALIEEIEYQKQAVPQAAKHEFLDRKQMEIDVIRQQHAGRRKSQEDMPIAFNEAKQKALNTIDSNLTQGKSLGQKPQVRYPVLNRH